MINTLPKMEILNIPVNLMTMTEVVDFLDVSIQKNEQIFLVTANAEIIMMAQKDEEYKKILTEQTNIILPDGAGVVWAGRHLGYSVPERVAGFDLFKKLLTLANAKSYKVFFFGGAERIAKEAAEIAKKNNPNLQVVGTLNGYFKEDESEEIVKKINDSGADLLFVALGAPKQEKWLAKWQKKLQVKLFMGIGGSFDVLSGKTKRAPIWMQRAGLEWLFRLIKEPFRFKRMFTTLPQFVIMILKK